MKKESDKKHKRNSNILLSQLNVNSCSSRNQILNPTINTDSKRNYLDTIENYDNVNSNRKTKDRYKTHINNNLNTEVDNYVLTTSQNLLENSSNENRLTTNTKIKSKKLKIFNFVSSNNNESICSSNNSNAVSLNISNNTKKNNNKIFNRDFVKNLKTSIVKKKKQLEFKIQENEKYESKFNNFSEEVDNNQKNQGLLHKLFNNRNILNNNDSSYSLLNNISNNYSYGLNNNDISIRRNKSINTDDLEQEMYVEKIRQRNNKKKLDNFKTSMYFTKNKKNKNDDLIDKNIFYKLDLKNNAIPINNEEYFSNLVQNNNLNNKTDNLTNRRNLNLQISNKNNVISKKESNDFSICSNQDISFKTNINNENISYSYIREDELDKSLNSKLKYNNCSKIINSKSINLYNSKKNSDNLTINSNIFARENDKFRNIHKFSNVFESLSDDELDTELMPSWFNIHPNNNLRKSWHLLFNLCLIFSAMYFPLFLAFESNYLTKSGLIIELAIDMISIIEIILKFLTGIYIKSNISYNFYKVLESHSLVYLILDFITSFPNALLLLAISHDYKYENFLTSIKGLDYNLNNMQVYYLIYNENPNNFILKYRLFSLFTKFLRFFRLFELMNVTKYNRKEFNYDKSASYKIFDYSNKNSLESYSKKKNKSLNKIPKSNYQKDILVAGITRVIILFLLFILITHIFACIWMYIGISNLRNGERSWITKANLYHKKLTDMYASSFYFCLVTIFSIGYGDITADTTNEKSFLIFFLIFGAIIYSYFISALSSLVQQYDPKQDNSKSVSIIYDLSNEYNLSYDLKSRLYNSIMSGEANIKKSTLEFFEFLPKNTRIELLIGMYYKHVCELKFFKSMLFNDDFLKFVIPMIEYSSHKNGDSIIEYGEILNKMYLVSDGRLNINLDFRYDYYTIAKIHRNYHYGDVCMFSNKASLISAKVDSRIANLFNINRDNLVQIKLNFTEHSKKILIISLKIHSLIEERRKLAIKYYNKYNNFDQFKEALASYKKSSNENDNEVDDYKNINKLNSVLNNKFPYQNTNTDSSINLVDVLSNKTNFNSNNINSEKKSNSSNNISCNNDSYIISNSPNQKETFKIDSPRALNTLCDNSDSNIISIKNNYTKNEDSIKNLNTNKLLYKSRHHKSHYNVTYNKFSDFSIYKHGIKRNSEYIIPKLSLKLNSNKKSKEFNFKSPNIKNKTSNNIYKKNESDVFNKYNKKFYLKNLLFKNSTSFNYTNVLSSITKTFYEGNLDFTNNKSLNKKKLYKNAESFSSINNSNYNTINKNYKQYNNKLHNLNNKLYCEDYSNYNYFNYSRNIINFKYNTKEKHFLLSKKQIDPYYNSLEKNNMNYNNKVNNNSTSKPKNLKKSIFSKSIKKRSVILNNNVKNYLNKNLTELKKIHFEKYPHIIKSSIDTNSNAININKQFKLNLKKINFEVNKVKEIKNVKKNLKNKNSKDKIFNSKINIPLTKEAKIKSENIYSKCHKNYSLISSKLDIPSPKITVRSSKEPTKENCIYNNNRIKEFKINKNSNHNKKSKINNFFKKTILDTVEICPTNINNNLVEDIHYQMINFNTNRDEIVNNTLFNIKEMLHKKENISANKNYNFSSPSKKNFYKGRNNNKQNSKSVKYNDNVKILDKVKINEAIDFNKVKKKNSAFINIKQQ